MQSINSTLDDALSWTTVHSRTNISSIDNLSLCSNASLADVSDLQGILGVVQHLKLKHIPYNSLREIGFVGEGNTFSVFSYQWHDRVVAVKHIKRKVLEDAKHINAFKRQLRSALQEILVMHHDPVARHPNIVNLIGYGWQLDNQKPLPYLVVDYGSLGSLRPFLIAKAPWPLKNKVILAGDIAAGLMLLHKSGILHGDLKLDNVVVFPTLERPCMCIAKICDFGHSAPLSASTEDEAPYYNGTPLYLPPEALTQKENPISLQDLHKCDIWAFGLCLWEILIDGKVYFQKEWSSDASLTRAPPYSTCSSPTLVNVPIHTPATTSTTGSYIVLQRSDKSTLDDEREKLFQHFGTFDPYHLQALAQKALKDVCPRQNWERSYLAPLLRSTLNVDPAKRMTDLYRSPLMNVWHKTDPQIALQAQLAVHARASGDSFDIFRPDRQGDIPWEYQVHIMQDFEAVVANEANSTRLASACFQLMVCHALGFGCDVDLTKASWNLQRATELGLSIAQLFCDTLSDAMTSSPPKAVPHHTRRIAQGFSAQRQLSSTSSLYLCKELDPDKDNRWDLFSTANMAPTTVLERAIAVSSLSRDEVLATTFLYASIESLSLSWLDYAILKDDVALIKLCCDVVSTSTLDRPGAWGETPLILACRKGSTEVLKTLIASGHNPAQSVEGDYNILHWLFCLVDDAVTILDLLMSLSIGAEIFSAKINECCTGVHKMHPQWPTEMTGTPLAFAITAGHRALVQRLLKFNADPLSSIHPSATNNAASGWTPVHLAVKYNFALVVQDLCAHIKSKQPELQVSDDPWKHLRFPCFQLASALSYMTPLERYGIHGSSSTIHLRNTIAALPELAIFWASTTGITPIWQAIDFENTEVVEALLNANAELARTYIQDPQSPTSRMLPLHYAAQICARRDSQDALTIPKSVLAAHELAHSWPDGEGRLPLHYSVTTNFSVVTTWLLTVGCPVDAADNSKRVPLMLCRSGANTAALLQHGADVNLQDNDGFNAAHHAVAKGNTASLPLLVKEGIDLDKVGKVHGTPLHVAVASLSKADVKELCKMGVSVNLCNREGDKPLHLAVEAKRSDIVEILLQHGANPLVPNHSAVKPTSTAIRQIGSHKLLEVQSELRTFEALFNTKSRKLSHDDKRLVLVDILNDCARYGGQELIKFFLLHPEVKGVIDANTTQDGQTPLHSAARSARTETARALLDFGADPNILDNMGYTPLMTVCYAQAVGGRRGEFCDILLSTSPDLNVVNNDGKTIWMIAHEQGDFSLMSSLLERVPEKDAQAMIEKAPITWTLIHNSLVILVRRFAIAALRFPQYVHFLNDPAVLADVAAALNCDADRKTVVGVLNDLLREDRCYLARDAMCGRSVVVDMTNLLLHERYRGTPYYDRLMDGAGGRAKLLAGDEVSSAITEYLEQWEPLE